MKLPANVSPTDPLAVLIAACVGILGTFHVWSRLGLTADDVAELGSAALAVAAIVRTWWLSRQSKAEA
jgi:hypothetical protein